MGERVAHQARWLLAAIADVPGLAPELAGEDRVRLRFPAPAGADQFHRALLAESMPAELEESLVELRVAPWYTQDDVESIALAVAKVAHYLGV